MTLHKFEKRLNEIGFKGLTKNQIKYRYNKEIYDRYCTEKGWDWVKKIDEENLSILIRAIYEDYAILSNQLEIQITADFKSLFQKIVFRIPNPILAIYYNDKNTSDTKNSDFHKKHIFLRKGRIIKVLLCPKNDIDKLPKYTQLNSKNMKENINNYFYKLNLYRLISNSLCIRPIIRIYRYILGPDKLDKLVRHLVRIIWPLMIKTPIAESLTKYRFKKLSENEFLSLELIDQNPLNELIRKPQFDRVTNDGKLEKVSDLIAFLKTEEGLYTILSSAIEPKELVLEDIPMHLNRQFWNNGNRYFINCILAQFRKNVPPYSELTKLEKPSHPFYSMKYYESLELMTESEIRVLLTNSPISIRKNALSGGRHKMFAMIGRMAFGKTYIPFWVDRFL